MPAPGSLLELLKDVTAGETREFVSGDRIFRQGDPVRHLCALEEGQVKLERVTGEGRAVLMYLASPGETFAEAALFSETYHCDAVAIRPSRVRFLPREPVLRAIRDDAGTAEEIISLLASQVRTLRSRLETRNILSARDRIIHHLLLAAPEGGQVILDSSLMNLAAELGLAHETLYRELAALEKEGRLKRDGNTISLS